MYKFVKTARGLYPFSMDRTPLHQQVDTLPELLQEIIDPFTRAVQQALPEKICATVQRVFITGCGDSHHAPLNAELAFEQLAGLPCEPMNAMQFARYGAAFLPQTGRGHNLLLAISVSGTVSRTTEALRLGRRAGATAVALTGNPDGPLAQEAEIVIPTKVPPLRAEQQGMIVPGTRSYIASQLMLYLVAIHLGQQRRIITSAQANKLRYELAGMADLMAETIALSDSAARSAVQAWSDATHFVFCGSGPQYGTALFSAAKLLEASGDIAIAQDMEEWAHLQYFGRETNTPTILISTGGADADRVAEIATAAQQIGRRVALIAPAQSALARTTAAHMLLPTAASPRECFAPLLSCLPGTLFAAYRAQLLGEPYFRDFAGGRSVEGGGGISRIRTSQQLDDFPA